MTSCGHSIEEARVDLTSDVSLESPDFVSSFCHLGRPNIEQVNIK